MHICTHKPEFHTFFHAYYKAIFVLFISRQQDLNLAIANMSDYYVWSAF